MGNQAYNLASSIHRELGTRVGRKMLCIYFVDSELVFAWFVVTPVGADLVWRLAFP